MRKQSLLQGAFVLTAAGFVTKILGFATTILQSRILGAEAIGLQMMVMPYAGLLMTVTTLGMPVAVSKVVAEAEASGDRQKIRRILFVSLAVTLAAASALTFGLAYFGQAIAARFLADQRAYYSLMALIPMIPILAVSGIVRGYFQGRQNMNPLAISHVIEQIIRIALLYILVQLLAARGLEYAAAGAVLAGAAGELASLIYLLFSFRPTSIYRIVKNRYHRSSQSRIELLELAKIGISQTGNQFFRSLLRAVQPTVISRSLLSAGLDPSAVAAQYGMLTGYVYPLLFFPGFVNYSLAVALVPAISEAGVKHQYRLVTRRVSQAIRASLLIGIPSSMILFVFAEQILAFFYRAPEAAGLLRLTAPFYLFQYFHSPLQSSLIGLGHAALAMVNNVIPRCISLALIYPLSVQLNLGIAGVAVASSLAVVLETILQYLALYRYAGPCLRISDVAKMAGCGIPASLFGYITYDTLRLYQVGESVSALGGIAALLFLYFSLIFLTKTVRLSSIMVALKRR
ncbi:MAG TPA: stage V sporulation protein B [Limnochordia bacterium]|nr:stage V sporulation protein B [Limnochordia bacterium]